MSTADLTPGTEVGGYVIERKLGSGGMGAVYLASHPNLPKQVALKVLAEAHDAEGFAAEARLAAQLDHPNIVDILDFGESDGALWMSMGYVSGGDLARLVAQHPGGVPPGRAVHILTEVAKALDFAHARGVVHRDIKPANVFLAPGDGGTDRVLVGDFGIARNLDATVVTRTGTASRTDAYAPPEQRAGRAVDHRADVYALSVTCYELLTGHLPAVVVGRRRDRLPAALRPVLEKATAGDPDDRYPSCGAFVDAVTTALRERPARRLPARGRFALAGVTTIVALGALAWAIQPDSTPPPDVSASPSDSLATSSVDALPERCHFTTTVPTGDGRHAVLPSTSDGNRQCLLAFNDSHPTGGRAAPPIEGVRALQDALRRCYQHEFIDADGVYDPATAQAVLTVQDLHRIGRDGIFGPQTSGAMKWPQFRTTDGAFTTCTTVGPP
ncbi:serine/threonine-protein kinase [Nocardia sp. NPDC019395]|uniref:serine/threonine-protein kinase n=1 Tax=Nocardia sp. NPDC019395 TaxID=3154686 RepID=UPI00340399DB